MSRIRDDEGGFSLVELLVVCLVLGAVLAGMYRVLDNTQSATSGAAERLINLDEARVLMDTVTKDFRTAARLTDVSTPLEYADWQHATFYGRLNTTGQPILIDVSLDDEGRLVEQLTDPVCNVSTVPCPEDLWTYPGPARTRIVGRWVDRTISVFKYYDGGGFEIVPTTPTAALDATQRARIRAVEITLSISRTPTGSARATTLTNRVRLPNIRT